MIWIAVIVGVFLFYKFVEKPHKIIFFKTLGILLVIAVIGISGFYIYTSRLEKNPKVLLRVEDVFATKKIDEPLKEGVASRIFIESVLYDEPYKQMNSTEKDVVEWILSPNAPFDFKSERYSNVYEKIYEKMYIKNDGLEWEDLDRYEVERTKKELTDDVPGYVKDLQIFRKRSKDSRDKNNRIAELIFYQRYKSLSKESGLAFMKNFTADEKTLIDKIQNEADYLKQKYVDELNKIPGEVKIIVNICNDGKRDLLKTDFRIAGLSNGRSSQMALDSEVRNTFDSDTAFSSDIIIKPGKCTYVTWTTRYNLFFKYEVTSKYGTWSDGS